MIIVLYLAIALLTIIVEMIMCKYESLVDNKKFCLDGDLLLGMLLTSIFWPVTYCYWILSKIFKVFDILTDNISVFLFKNLNKKK